MPLCFSSVLSFVPGPSRGVLVRVGEACLEDHASHVMQ